MFFCLLQLFFFKVESNSKRPIKNRHSGINRTAARAHEMEAHACCNCNCTSSKMQAGSIFGGVKMKKTFVHSSFGGWIAYTHEDPKKVLRTIWKIARVDYTGLKGYKNSDEEELRFWGITIRVDKDYLQNTFVHELNLEITDKEKIQPEFFDMWEYLVKSALVWGGPKSDDKEQFIDTRSEDEKVLEDFAEAWINRQYVRRKKYSMVDWMQAHGVPTWIHPKKFQRCVRKLKEKKRKEIKF